MVGSQRINDNQDKVSPIRCCADPVFGFHLVFGLVQERILTGGHASGFARTPLARRCHGRKHTNLGPGSGLQNKRRPFEFNYGLGAYRLASLAANTGRWDGEIPLQDKLQYREAGVAEAFWEECMASDPTSKTRNPPSLRAPNGVLEDTFMQLTGRRIWNASSIYVPTLVIAGEHDTGRFPRTAKA